MKYLTGIILGGITAVPIIISCEELGIVGVAIWAILGFIIGIAISIFFMDDSREETWND